MPKKFCFARKAAALAGCSVMASPLVSKAKNELVKMNERMRRARQAKKEEAQEVTRAVSVLAGAAAAALVDERFGVDGEVAEIANVPTNAIIGGGAVVSAALIRGMPMRKELASAGLGMASASLYQLIRDRVDFSPQE